MVIIGKHGVQFVNFSSQNKFLFWPVKFNGQLLDPAKCITHFYKHKLFFLPNCQEDVVPEAQGYMHMGTLVHAA